LKNAATEIYNLLRRTRTEGTEERKKFEEQLTEILKMVEEKEKLISFLEKRVAEQAKVISFMSLGNPSKSKPNFSLFIKLVYVEAVLISTKLRQIKHRYT